MIDIWDKIIKEARGVKLEQSEKDFLIQSLITHIDAKKSELEVTHTSYFSYLLPKGLFSFSSRSVSVSFLIIFFLLGGTSFAASYALPGEALYAIKINVNEELESILALSPNTNARFESVKADRRLKEIEKLVTKKKKITPKAKIQIKQSLSKNTDNLKKIADEIEAKGDVTKATEVKSIFVDKLENHSNKLIKLVNSKDTDTKLFTTEDSNQEIHLEGTDSDIEEIKNLLDEQIEKVKNQEKETLKEDLSNVI